jgi:hypothetical protein
LAVGVRERTMVLKISVACWRIVLLICGGATFAACATGGSGGIQPHPRLRQAYFAKTVPVTGHYLREYNLPPKVSQSAVGNRIVVNLQADEVGGFTSVSVCSNGFAGPRPSVSVPRTVAPFIPHS